MNMFLIFFQIIKIIGVSYSSTYSLSSATILLPRTSPQYEKVTHELSIFGPSGCFRFLNSQEDIIGTTVTESKYDEKLGIQCVSKMILIPLSTSESREGSIITFSDAISGLSLKAHAFIANIAKLEIVTRRRILFIGDVREKIEVIAYDSAGNIFSSLVGAMFEWRISCIDKKDCKSRLPASLSSFGSSNYEVNPKIIEIEGKGFRGNEVLLEAMFKGDISVSVKLIDSKYEHISANVLLHVREYVTLEPPGPIYLIPGSYVTFKAFRLVAGKYSQMKIPDSYKLHVSNSTVTPIHKDDQTVFASVHGKSEVYLIESLKTNFQVDLHPQKVLIEVVDPTHLTLSCEQQENWIFEIEKEYTINYTFHYFDKILNVTSLNFDTTWKVSENLTSIKFSTDKNQLIIKTTKFGSFEFSILVTKFKTIHNTTFLSVPLSASVTIEIVSSPVILPKLMIVPFVSNRLLLKTYSFYAKGGSGRYTWLSSPESIFNDSQKPIFHQPSKPGIYDVSVADYMNRYITSHAKLMVVVPIRILLKADMVDVPISTYINVSVYLFGIEQNNDNIEITEFSLDLFDISLSDNKTFIDCSYANVSNKTICAKSESAGCVTLLVALKGTSIKSSLQLCSFVSLHVVSSDRFAIPGSFVTVNVTGGPISLPRKNKKDLQVYILNSLFNLYSSFIYDGSRDRIDSLKFQCLKPGNETIRIISEIVPSNIDVMPFKESIIYNIYCFDPTNTSLKIIPNYNRSECIHKLQTLTYDTNILHFTLYLLNSYPIHDLSGFKLKTYSLSRSCRLRSQLSSPISHKSYISAENSGIFKIRPNFCFGHTHALFVFIPKHNFSYLFSHSVSFNVVKAIKLDIDNIYLINHQLNHKNIRIFGGSGNFNFSNVAPVAKIEHYNNHFRIYPKNLGILSVVISDSCANLNPINLKVTVTTIRRMEIDHPDKLLVNTPGILNISLYNEYNQIIDESNHHFVLINFKFINRQPDFIDKSLNVDSIMRYKLFGLQSYVHEFVVEAIIGDTFISSEKRTIEIYQNIYANPSPLNMVPDQVSNIAVFNGPTYNSHVRFESSSDCFRFYQNNYTVVAIRACSETLTIISFSLDSFFKESILSVYHLLIQISPVKRIDIDLINNKFYVQTQIPAKILLFNQYGLVSNFISLSPKYYFVWNTDHNGYIKVLAVEDPLSTQIILKNIVQGISEVNVELSITNENISRFKASKTLHVVRNLHPFDCSFFILLPPKIRYNLNQLFMSSTVSFHFSDYHQSDFDHESGIINTPHFPSSVVITTEVIDSRKDIVHKETFPLHIKVSDIAMIFFEHLSDKNTIHVGQIISYRLLVVDNMARPFYFVPSTFFNFTVHPIGIIEIINFKNNNITLKAISIGHARVLIHSPSNIQTTYLPINVITPFIDEWRNISLGSLLFYNFPRVSNSDLKFRFSNPNIITYHSYNTTSISILTKDVGITDIEYLFQNRWYPILHINITPPKYSISIDSPKHISDTNRIYYIDLDTPISMISEQTAISSFPIECSIDSAILLPISVNPKLNPKTGRLACAFEINSQMSHYVKFNLIISFRSSQKFKPIIYPIEYIPNVNSLKDISTPILVNKCVFDDIHLSFISSNESLYLSSSLSCLELSYRNDYDTGATIIRVMLSKCLGHINQNTFETITVFRPLTNQTIRIPINILYDVLPCLHSLSIAYLLNVKFIIGIVVICITIIMHYRYNIFCNYFSRKPQTRIDSTPISSFLSRSSPSPIRNVQIKQPTTFGNNDDFISELYTTRKEKLNSSLKK